MDSCKSTPVTEKGRRRPRWGSPCERWGTACGSASCNSRRAIGTRESVRPSSALAPELSLLSFAAARWGDPSKASPGTPWWLLPPSEEDRAQAQEGLEFARHALSNGAYDVVVLDEVFAALKHGLVSLEQVVEVVKSRPAPVELVMTGRSVPPEIVELADLVTEMKAVKHPFAQGIAARRGIEY